MKIVSFQYICKCANFLCYVLLLIAKKYIEKLIFPYAHDIYLICGFLIAVWHGIKHVFSLHLMCVVVYNEFSNWYGSNLWYEFIEIVFAIVS